MSGVKRLKHFARTQLMLKDSRYDIRDIIDRITIRDITGGNTDRLETFLDLYVELFPQYTRYLPIMRQIARLPANADPRFVEHQWLIEIDDQAAGLTVFKYVPGRNCGLGLELGIRPSYRRLSFGCYRRFAELVIHLRLEQLQADALAARQPTPIGLVLEVEAPKLVARFCEYGFVELPVEYYEPPFIRGLEALADPVELEKTSFHRMYLGIYPIEGGQFDLSDTIMLTDLVFAFLVDHYGLPEEHWAVRCALSSIALQANRGIEHATAKSEEKNRIC